MISNDTQDYDMRFGAIGRLFGLEAFNKLRQSHICIVGLGGVGSWAAESLVRSGVGKITLIDLDEICQTNTNRQLHALQTNVGKSKIQILKERFLNINPDCQIILEEDFLGENNVKDLITNEMDAVLDAIDGLTAKCHLAIHCKEIKMPLITCGAAAGKDDPTTIKAADLGMAINDMLLKQMRKKLRRVYDWPKDKGELGVVSVFSAQRAVYPDGRGGFCHKSELKDKKQTALDCSTGMGTASFMTGTMGFVAARETIRAVLND